jgi:hypothetical protein
VNFIQMMKVDEKLMKSIIIKQGAILEQQVTTNWLDL